MHNVIVSRAERTVVVSMGCGVGVNGDCLGSTDERMFLPWAAVRDIVAQAAVLLLLMRLLPLLLPLTAATLVLALLCRRRRRRRYRQR